MRTLIISIFLLILFGLTACSKKPKGNFDEGLAAYERNDYPAALKEFKPLAEGDHTQAQGKLCEMHMEQKGVPYDAKELLQWCRKAAENGHAKAQFILGSFYGRGGIVPENHATAGSWYVKAADQGDIESLYGLASVLGYGDRVKHDVVAGYALYTLYATRDPSKKDRAISSRKRFVEDLSLTPAQIAEGEELAAKWATPGTVLSKELAKR